MIVASITGATLVLAVAGWYFGSPVIAWIFGASFTSPPTFVVGCIVAAGLIGVVTVTGGALLATGRHGGQLAGWSIAAVVSIVVLVLPLDDLYVRVVSALLIGPAVGLCVHLVSLRRPFGRQAAAQP